MWDRRQEHITALEGENKESPLFENMEESHRDMDPEFKLKIVGFYKKPLQRQTMEGLLIGKAKEGTYMNQRGEWGQNFPPKLEVVDLDEELRPRENQNQMSTKRRKVNQNQIRQEGQSQSQVSKKVKLDAPDKRQDEKREKSGLPLTNPGLFEDGGAMAQMSWEKVQTEESNRSILQFFNSKGTPLTKKNWVKIG